MLYPARIIYNNGNSTLDCAILALSETDIQIRIEILVNLPDFFKVDLKDGRIRPVQVVSRRALDLIGRFADLPNFSRTGPYYTGLR